jgi:hypothetical protein
MNFSGWWDSLVGYLTSVGGYWTSSDGQAVLPGLALVVSTLIALYVLAAQLQANLKQLRGALIEKLMERLAEVAVQAAARHEQLKSGQYPTHSLQSAMKYFDASVSALRFSLPRAERGVVDFIRNAVHENSRDDEDSFTLMADADRALRLFEAWALGQIPTRKFRRFNRYGAGPGRRPEFQEEWARLARQMKANYDIEGGDAGFALYKKTRRYRAIRRRALSRRRFRDVIRQFWLELRHPTMAPQYRKSRAEMRAIELSRM